MGIHWNVTWSRRAKTLITLLVTLAVAVGGSLAVKGRFDAQTPSPLGGTADLRSWDFVQGGSVPLGGTWEFLPEAMVPGSWFAQPPSAPTLRRVPDTRFSKGRDFFLGTGGGTYHLRVLVPPGQNDLGLRLSTIWTAYELEIDGVIVARVGNPSTDASQETADIAPVLVPLPASDGSLDLVIRVSNHLFRWGGIITPPSLGYWKTLTAEKQSEEITDYLLVGVLGGMALFALFLFGFRRTDVAFISFAVFSFLIIMRVLTTDDRLLAQLIPGISFDTFVRLQYMALYLLIPAAAVFYGALFPEEISRKELSVFLGISAFPALLVPWAPLWVLSWELLLYVVPAGALIGYGYWVVCVRTSLRDRPGAPIMLVAGTFLLGISMVNILDQVLMARVESVFQPGLFSFAIVQALVLAYRSIWAMEQTEKLTNELKQTNKVLAAETREAEEARGEVEKSLVEKEVLLKEVHHRVKNSLQIVLSIIGLETRRTQNTEVRLAYQGIRDRIRAISLVHDRLYGMESERHVDAVEYLRELTLHLGEGLGEAKVYFEATEEILVPMDYCLDIGLVITELVINSYRHSGTNQSSGTVRVQAGMDENKGLRFTVSDEGPGFPADFSPQTSNSAGFKIVTSLVQGRKGHLQITPGPGARIDISFPPLSSAEI